MKKDTSLHLRVDDDELALIDAMQAKMHLTNRADVLRQGIHALKEKLKLPSPPKK